MVKRNEALDFLEEQYLQLQKKSFSEEGIDDGSYPLSVSTPTNVAIEFIDTARFNGCHWRELLIEFMKWYIERFGSEVCVEICDRKIVEYLMRKERQLKRIASKGSMKEKSIRQLVDEYFVGVETFKARNSTVLQRSTPVSSIDVSNLFKALDGKLNKKHERHIENGAHKFSKADLYPFVLERAGKITNEVVKKSFLDNLSEYKADKIDNDPEEREKAKEQSDLHKLLDEYYPLIKKLESNPVIEPGTNDLPDAAGQPPIGRIQPEVIQVVKRDGQ